MPLIRVLPCPICRGARQVALPTHNPAIRPVPRTCPRCAGRGTIIAPTTRASAKVARPRKLSNP